MHTILWQEFAELSVVNELLSLFVCTVFHSDSVKVTRRIRDPQYCSWKKNPHILPIRLCVQWRITHSNLMVSLGPCKLPE